MSNAQLVADVAEERLVMADLFESLTEGQLRTPSLCDGWTVKDVAAHLTASFNVTLPEMFVRVLGEQLSIARAIDRLTKQLAGRPIEGIVAQLRAQAGNDRHPPGAPLAPLVEVIVHGEDVRRPLGIGHTVPFERVSAAMEFVTGGRAVGFLPGSRVRGLRFVATDGDGAWGKGNIIHGPAMSLLLAALGRRVALADLGGATNVLADRLTR